MEDNSRQMSRMFNSNKLRRWPLAVGILTLALGHAAFFLPLRAFVPVAPEADAWWGIGIVLADGMMIVMLVQSGLRKLIRKKDRAWEE